MIHTCDAYQVSDLMVCPCGLRWDVNDDHPPECPAEKIYLSGIAAQAEEVSKATQRLSPLYKPVYDGWARFFDVGGKWFVGLSMLAALVYLILAFTCNCGTR